MSFKKTNDFWYVSVWNHQTSWMISSRRNYCSKVTWMAFNKSHWSLRHPWSIGTLEIMYESSFRTKVEMKRNSTCFECNLSFIQPCWSINSRNFEHERKSNRQYSKKVYWWCWWRYDFNSCDCTLMNFRYKRSNLDASATFNVFEFDNCVSCWNCFTLIHSDLLKSNSQSLGSNNSLN